MTPYEQQLLRLTAADDRVLVMTAENRAPMRNIIAELGERFIDVGIAEQTLIGMAAGLAMNGRRPIVHALASFLTMRAFEFIRTDVGIPRLPVILVGFVPGFLSDANGPTHQALEDISLMRGIPGVNVFCPSSIDELASALPELVKSNSPWYVRFAPTSPSATMPAEKFVLHHPMCVCDGRDIALLTFGRLLEPAYQAAEILAGRGISCSVVNLHTIKPIPEEFLENCLVRYPMIVTIEDHFRHGGISSLVAGFIGERANKISRRGGIVPFFLPVTLGDRWFTPALLKEVLEVEGFTAEALENKIQSTFEAEVLHAE
jgi:transketolase